MSRFFSDRVTKLVVCLVCMSLLWTFGEDESKWILLMRSMLSCMQIVSLVSQIVNLSWKTVVQNADYVFAYFWGGYKNNLWLYLRSSFNILRLILLLTGVFSFIKYIVVIPEDYYFRKISIWNDRYINRKIESVT